MKKYILIILASIFIINAKAQEKIGNVIEFDKLIHDFGDILESEKDLKCSFSFKNISKKPLVLYSVVASCGCTDVEWSKQPILPGKKSVISVNYTNEDGPYPFNKTLTLYISGTSNPIILRIKGVAYEEQKPIEEMYPLYFGPFSMRTNILECGNISQGGSRSDEIMVANRSSKPIKLDFKIETPGLNLTVKPNPIPAKSSAQLVFTIKAQKELWGKNYYYAKPIVDGKEYAVSGKAQDLKTSPYIGDLDKNPDKIAVYAFTKENFDNITREDKTKAAKPIFKTSTFSFGKTEKGKEVTAQFDFKNTGESDFIVHKVDVDIPNAKISQITPTKKGEIGKLTVKFNTNDLPKGEGLVIITLTTNSPMRPIINLFATGWIL